MRHGHTRALVALLSLPHVSALLSLRPANPLSPSPVVASPSVRSIRCSANPPPPPPPDIPARDLSREIAKYDSKGFRLRTSGPARRVGGALDTVRSGVRSVTRFGQTLTTVPVHQGLLGLTVVAYGAQQAGGQAAMLAGARMNEMITIGGQWHRLVSPVFMHGSFMHLASNAFSLFRVGPLMDQTYGPGRTLLIYLLSGLGGNLAGLWFGDARSISVGASGAVFGMMGAVAAFVIRNGHALGRAGDALLSNVGQVLLLNLFIGTRRGSGIDNLAHVGGAISGAIAGYLLAPDVSQYVRRRSTYGDDDGALLPPFAIRAALAAAVAAYVLGLYEAVRYTGVVRRMLMMRMAGR